MCDPHARAPPHTATLGYCGSGTASGTADGRDSGADDYFDDFDVDAAVAQYQQQKQQTVVSAYPHSHASGARDGIEGGYGAYQNSGVHGNAGAHRVAHGVGNSTPASTGHGGAGVHGGPMNGGYSSSAGGSTELTGGYPSGSVSTQGFTPSTSAWQQKGGAALQAVAVSGAHVSDRSYGSAAQARPDEQRSGTSIQHVGGAGTARAARAYAGIVQPLEGGEWAKSFPWTSELRAKNAAIFRNPTFRGCQEAVMNAALSNKDVFVLMPTGGGKSRCYQLPAAVSTGVTVVLSPLVSLLKDQLQHLAEANIPAAGFQAGAEYEMERSVYEDLRCAQPTLKLVFVTPEKVRCNA